MAIREIRVEGDPVLKKVSREIDIINERTITLLNDMAETMYHANGIGLAAPQVGVLRRVVTLNVGSGLIEMINPVIVESEGECNSTEACLSVPNKVGDVLRPTKVVVEYLDRTGEKKRMEAEELAAIAICHELDHLDGVLYVDKAVAVNEIADGE
ncbi:MAG: peptide deformylase [Tissierellia bacterium]|nr:peptide deformylase [Tissierellia bacterium]